MHSLRKTSTSEDLLALLSSSLGPQAFIQEEGLAQFLLAANPKQVKAQVIPSWNHGGEAYTLNLCLSHSGFKLSVILAQYP